METALESQLLKIIGKISKAEKMKNRSLARQTAKLVRTLFGLKTMNKNVNDEGNEL